MKRVLFLTTLLFQFSNIIYAQQSNRRSSYADLSGAIGQYKGSFSISYNHAWSTGAKRKLALGLGARFTTFLGANQYYITAPSRITSGSTSPLIFFKENIAANIDSLLIKSPQVNAMNICINIGYTISKKLALAFTIDAIGFSFGGTRRGNYINGVQGKNTDGKPTPFNLLLISDNDKGTLNSEFYGRYSLSDKWAVKAGGQFLFTEYTTKTAVQELPIKNDRFRNKALLFALGLIRNL